MRRCLWILIVILSPLALASEFVVTVRATDGKPLEDTAVVLQPLDAKPAGRARKKVSIEQSDRDFRPYVTIIQRGAAIDFPNRDPFKHHVYSFSPAKQFEIKLYKGHPASPVVFDSVGLVVLGCNVHDWMQAFVLVVDSPYFAKTSADGLARIAGAPPGRYALHVWHPRQLKQIDDQELVLGGKTEPREDLMLAVTPPVVYRKPEASGSY